LKKIAEDLGIEANVYSKSVFLHSRPLVKLLA